MRGDIEGKNFPFELKGTAERMGFSVINKGEGEGGAKEARKGRVKCGQV